MFFTHHLKFNAYHNLTRKISVNFVNETYDRFSLSWKDEKKPIKCHFFTSKLFCINIEIVDTCSFYQNSKTFSTFQ